MTTGLRDELAKAALIGRLSHPHWSNCQTRPSILQGGCPGGDFPPEFYAAIYRDADAMLAARGPEPVSIVGDWTYATTTSPPPFVNQVRLNHVDPELATMAWVSNLTLAGHDDQAALMQATGEFTMQDTTDADRSVVFTINDTPIDRVDYVTLPLNPVRGGSAPLQAGRIFIQFHTLLGAT